MVFLEYAALPQSSSTQGEETRPRVHSNILRLLNYIGTNVVYTQTLWAATMWLSLTSTNQVSRNS